MAKPVECGTCGHEWWRDPVLEVPCPTCSAKAGQRCRRPSGHKVPGFGHDSRDLLAADRGFYDHECNGLELRGRQSHDGQINLELS